MELQSLKDSFYLVFDISSTSGISISPFSQWSLLHCPATCDCYFHFFIIFIKGDREGRPYN